MLKEKIIMNYKKIIIILLIILICPLSFLAIKHLDIFSKKIIENFEFANEYQVVESSDNVFIGVVEKRKGIIKENYRYTIRKVYDIKGETSNEFTLHFDQVNDIPSLTQEELVNCNYLLETNNVYMFFAHYEKDGKYSIDHTGRVIRLDNYDLNKSMDDQQENIVNTYKHYLNLSKGIVPTVNLELPESYDFVAIVNTDCNEHSFQSLLGCFPKLVQNNIDIPLILIDEEPSYLKYFKTGDRLSPKIMYYNANVFDNSENGVKPIIAQEIESVTKGYNYLSDDYLVFGHYIENTDISYNSFKPIVVVTSNEDIIKMPEYINQGGYENQPQEYKDAIQLIVNNKLEA